MVIVNTQGIVLRAVKYKENDLILTIFTRKLGKISAIAKGARRTKSALLSSCQVFAYSTFTLKKQGSMYSVTQTEIIKSFYEISYNLDAFSYATYIIQLIDYNLEDEITNNRLFILLAQTLYLFAKEEIDMIYIKDVFELKFLDYIGFRPVVNRCSNCGNKNLNNSVFNIYEGGVICKNCRELFEYNMKIDLTTIRLMEYILNNDILTCNKAKVSKYIVKELDVLLKRYLNQYIDNRGFKSLNLIESIENKKGAE